MTLVLRNVVSHEHVTIDGVTRFCCSSFFALSLNKRIDSIKVFTCNRSFHYPSSEWIVLSCDAR